VSDIRKIVGSRVRELRLVRHLTQEQLGARAGLSYKFIGEVERGIGNPTIETLVDIAGALDVDIADLTTSGRAKPGRHLPPADYAALRDVRNAIDGILRRLAPARPRRRPRH
jgi:transcriptional regulator with XRE-family HTH domain